MGLRDDAIREHLELKRKHGADPEDVARQEQEALGPGKRNEFAHAEPEPEPELGLEPPAPEDLPTAEPSIAAIAAGDAEDPWLDEDRDEVPADEALQPPRAGDEDVLEETPDF